MPDDLWMQRAIDLARRAVGQTRPNPAVGCVIVRGGDVLAEGFHARAGAPHAEVTALAACTADPRSATLYVTLEPCNHSGRTPPCTEAILRAGIGRVVVGARDPNPLAGGGVERLREAGVDVSTGVLERECVMLNPGFHVFHRRKRPLVTLKWALTADGCTSAGSGHSRWISSEASRHLVHQFRAEHDAIVAGSATVLMDNARLTVRGVPGADIGPPRRRIVLDSALAIPPDHPLVSETRGTATLVCIESAPAAKEERLLAAGADVWRLPADAAGRVDLRALLDRLAREECHALLVEGGRTVAGAFLVGGLVDRVLAFVAPVVLGGGEAHLGALVHPSPPDRMDAAIRLLHPEWRPVGEDILLSGWLKDPLAD